MTEKTIFITGYAKLPNGITAQQLYSVVAIGLLVDRETGIIVDADCTLVTSTGKKFFRENVLGKNIIDYNSIEKIFLDRYFGSAKKAILSALRICSDKFEMIQNGEDYKCNN